MIYRVNTMVVWLTIAQGTDFFREGLEHGYFVMRKDGKGPRQLDSWNPQVIAHTNEVICQSGEEAGNRKPAHFSHCLQHIIHRTGMERI